jgi:hypothetical protein
MLMEHTFVTTLDMGEAMDLASGFLGHLGFRLKSVTPNAIQAVRGRKQPTSRKVKLLPQSVDLTYDRGRVTVAATITPRGRKGRPIYGDMLTSLARGLEMLLVDRASDDQAGAEWAMIHAKTPRIWSIVDKIVIVCLMAILLAVLLLIALAVRLALTG